MPPFLNTHWFPVLAYAISIVGSSIAGLIVLKDMNEPRHARSYFWLEVTLLLGVLVLLKLSRAEAFVANVGREAARNGGWYGDRRVAQTIAVCTITATAILLYPLAIWAYREARYRLPLATVFLLLAFIATRAISLHQIDTVLYRRMLGGIQQNQLIEPSLTLLVSMAALLFVGMELLKGPRSK